MSPVSTIQILFVKFWLSFSFNALYISVKQENIMELRCFATVIQHESQQMARQTQLYVLANTRVLFWDYNTYQCARNSY